MRNTNRHKHRVGYCYNKRARLWSVYLDEPGQKRRYLGYTKTIEEAQERVDKERGYCTRVKNPNEPNTEDIEF
jgi:hypothetical protein